MKLTIIVPDSAVYVDNVNRIPLDLSNCGIPENIHALQWHNDAGWVEYVMNADGTKPMNDSITEIPEWANACVAVWEANPPKPPINPADFVPPEIA